MEKKICPVCKIEVDEEIKVCPECGASLEDEEILVSADDVVSEEAEEIEIGEIDAEEAIVEDIEEISEEDDETFEDDEYDESDAENDEATVKSGKLVRFVAFFLAVVVLFFGGKFLWSNFGPGSVISVVSFDKEDAVGTYEDGLYGRYYTFKLDAKELETKGKPSSAESEEISYDGTYETGFTKEYINSVLVNQYVIDNNLLEEYESYIKENELLVDDFNGFAKNKKITKEQLDAIDQEYQYVQMGNNYKTTGKWSYDDKAKLIMLYDEAGNQISTLYVKREGLVADSGYMAGRSGFGKTFNAKYVSRNYEYGVTETISTYNDGMCVSTIVQDGGKEPVYTAGTYKLKDGIIVFNISGETLRYRKVTGGLGFMVYTK
jgi:RNA polymerase subunit RPABC4/transcription elongation factor Spt4